MHVSWITTPSGTWLCGVDTYCGIIIQLDGMWAARIQQAETSYPADTLFESLTTAQAWIEEQLTARLAQEQPHHLH